MTVPLPGPDRCTRVRGDMLPVSLPLPRPDRGAPRPTTGRTTAGRKEAGGGAARVGVAPPLHSLARTGASIGIGVAALILLVAGGLLLLRRRGAGSDEDEHGEE